MLTIKEKAINNTFQIIEELKGRRNLYTAPIKVRFSLKAQPPGEVKMFSEEEIFLYRVKKRKEKKDYESITTTPRNTKTTSKS